MKEKVPLVLGFILFILLIISELTFKFLYLEEAQQSFESCLALRDVGASTNSCSMAIQSANAAFRSANANHIVMFIVIFTVFVFFGSVHLKTEKRLKEIEGRLNV